MWSQTYELAPVTRILYSDIMWLSHSTIIESRLREYEEILADIRSRDVV